MTTPNQGKVKESDTTHPVAYVSQQRSFSPQLPPSEDESSDDNEQGEDGDLLFLKLRADMIGGWDFQSSRWFKIGRVRNHLPVFFRTSKFQVFAVEWNTLTARDIAQSHGRPLSASIVKRMVVVALAARASWCV